MIREENSETLIKLIFSAIIIILVRHLMQSKFAGSQGALLYIETRARETIRECEFPTNNDGDEERFEGFGSVTRGCG